MNKTEPVLPLLKYLQPAQYLSWCRKADDPEWVHHRYRDAKENAMANAIRELRDQIALTDAATRERDEALFQYETYKTVATDAASKLGLIPTDEGWINARAVEAETERDALQARVDVLLPALEMMYDKWENGVSCYESGDGAYLGPAFELDDEENQKVMALLDVEEAKS